MHTKQKAQKRSVVARTPQPAPPSAPERTPTSQPVSTPDLAPTLSEARHALFATQLLPLQRLVGNRVVQQLLAEHTPANPATSAVEAHQQDEPNAKPPQAARPAAQGRQQAQRTPAAHSGAASGRPGAQHIQRTGVKSELLAADHKFSDFMDETEAVHDLRDKIADDLYNAYKPNPNDLQQAFDKRKHRDKNQGTVQEKIARIKAKRLNHWTDTAISSAQRIYLELNAAMKQAEDIGFGGEVITMGQDTDTESDAFINASTALEVKHVVTEAQGGVDEHVRKASAQLSKRVMNKKENNTPITSWVAHIKIQNDNNPWPYTPARLDGLINKGKAPSSNQVLAEAIKRLTKYKGKVKQQIFFFVESSNGAIGTINVTI